MISGMEISIPYEAGLLLSVGLLPVPLSKFLYVSSMHRPIDGLISIYYLYKLVRRPRLILDFALTLVFNHLVLSTYYSSSLPTSLFFWIVVLGGAALTIIMTEQLCVKREMSEGLGLPKHPDDLVEEMEMGGLSPRID